MTEYFYINGQPEKEIPTGSITTAALKCCCGCGIILDSMGGGGLYLCTDCRNTLSSGILRSEFNEAKK